MSKMIEGRPRESLVIYDNPIEVILIPAHGSGLFLDESAASGAFKIAAH